MPTIEINQTRLDQPIQIVIERVQEPLWWETAGGMLGVISSFVFGMFAITLAYRWWVQPVLWLYLETNDERSKLERANGCAPVEGRFMSFVRAAAGVPEEGDACLRVLQQENKAAYKRVVERAVDYLLGGKGNC